MLLESLHLFLRDHTISQQFISVLLIHWHHLLDLRVHLRLSESTHQSDKLNSRNPMIEINSRT